MSGFYVTIILSTIGVFSSCVWMIMLFQYIRALIDKNNGGNILTVLIVIEYILFGFITYLQIVKPYQLDSNIGFHHNYAPNLGINSTITLLLVIVYLLICITSFKHTNSFFRSNNKQFVWLIIISIILIVVTFFIQSKVFGTFTMDHDKRRLDKLTEMIVYVFSTVLFIFNCTRFRIDKQNKMRTIIYTVIPLIIFYAILLYCRIKFMYISPDEYSKYYSTLGGFG